ncbi:MAG: BspA family leucine-rich repeat surface protein [Clostridia bacterium]|nr:BspA family leucine-rich repeat surface protein [Clostridia bacterium]
MSTAEKLNYLLETKNQIRNAIEGKGVSIADTDSFRSYASKIGQIQGGGGNESSTDDWQPESDWWDIETILANDTEDYSQKIICLLTDELDDGATINIVKGATKYKLSDGQVIEKTASSELNISTLFDTTKDKICSKGYKTRYIIYYSNSDMIPVNLPNNAIYTIFSGVKFTGIFTNKSFLQAIKFMNGSKYKNPYASSFFSKCYSLKKIIGLDTSNFTNMDSFFASCYSLREIPNIDTSNVTTMNNMFASCYSLREIPNIDTSNVTKMSSMFSGCYLLREIPNIDTSNVTTMSSMFFMCYSLKEIPNINTSNVTNTSMMFYNCYSLKEIPNIDISNVANISTMFSDCRLLTNIQNITQIKTTLSFSGSIYLSHNSLLKILNALIDLSEQATQTLTLGATNLAKLTEEEIAVATDKGWTLA